MASLIRRQIAKSKLKAGLTIPSFRYGLNVQAAWRPETEFFSLPRIPITTQPKLPKGVTLGKPFDLSIFPQGCDIGESTVVADETRWLVVSAGTQLNEPLRLSSKTWKNGLNVSRVVVIVEAGSSVVILDEMAKVPSAAPSKGGFSINEVDVIVHPSASVYWLVDAEAPNHVEQIILRRAVVERQASLNLFHWFAGGKAQKHRTAVDMVGKGGRANVFEATMGCASQEFDGMTFITDAASETHSRFWSRTVLKDRAKAIVQGWIRVEKRAKGTNARQQIDGMLLNEGVEFDPIPNLEIEQNDVQCSHGATVTEPDEEQLFYLKSRGISATQARSELVRGFLKPVVFNESMLRLPALGQRCEQFLNQLP